MNSKPVVCLLLATWLACAPFDAHAWFFIFIPGSVVGKVKDLFTGAEGESCVAEQAKVGDVITSVSGNQATVKSLSGKSSRCLNPKLPIRALLAFAEDTRPKAGIDIPEGYEPKTLTDMQRFQGLLLHAEHPDRKVNIQVRTRLRGKADPAPMARNIAKALETILADAKAGDEEQFEVNGMPAWRVQVNGKNRGLFGQKTTHLVTVLAAPSQIVTLSVWAPPDRFDEDKEVIRNLPFKISGLDAPAAGEASPEAAAPSPGASAPEANPPAGAASGAGSGAAENGNLPASAPPASAPSPAASAPAPQAPVADQP